STDIHLPFLPHAETQCAGNFDVLGLAADENAELVWLDGSDRFHSDRHTLLVDLVPADVVQRDRVGREIERAMFPHELRPSGRTAVVEGFDAVEDMQHSFVANHGHLDHSRYNSAASIEALRSVAPADVFCHAVRK